VGDKKEKINLFDLVFFCLMPASRSGQQQQNNYSFLLFSSMGGQRQHNLVRGTLQIANPVASWTISSSSSRRRARKGVGNETDRQTSLLKVRASPRKRKNQKRKRGLLE